MYRRQKVEVCVLVLVPRKKFRVKGSRDGDYVEVVVAWFGHFDDSKERMYTTAQQRNRRTAKLAEFGYIRSLAVPSSGHVQASNTVQIKTKCSR